MIVLMALIRVTQAQPKLLVPHLPALMDAVLLALSPANVTLRRTCLQAGPSLSIIFSQHWKPFVESSLRLTGTRAQA